MNQLNSTFVTICLFIMTAPLLGQEPDDQEKAVLQSYKIAPSYFIPNTAQQKTGKRLVEDPEVVAFVQTQKGRVMFTPSGVYIGMTVTKENVLPEKMEKKRAYDALEDSFSRQTVVLKVGFAKDAEKNHKIFPQLEGEIDATVNFFLGSRENWRTSISVFRKIVYENVWESISLEYLAYMDRLEYQVHVKPGGDVSEIKLETGADNIKILASGQCLISLESFDLRMSKPFAYQTINDQKHEVEVQYCVKDNNCIGFGLGIYDPSIPLIIDPILTWNSYLGGRGTSEFLETGKAIAIDDSGNVFISGFTPSGDFPVVVGSYDETNNGYTDVFLTKINSDGSDLIFSTYIGGAHGTERVLSADSSYGLAVDSTGNVYITGSTASINFPTTIGAYDTTYNGDWDVFVTKVNSNGTDLLYSTLLGGSESDLGYSIDIDNMGNVYVTGTTYSDGFPVTSGAYDETFNGETDVFITKLNNTGTGLLYSTFIGGENDETGYSIALDEMNFAYITGYTKSDVYPTTLGAFDESLNYGSSSFPAPDVFVTKLNPSGTDLVYSTYLGGRGLDKGYDIVVDRYGDVYVTGSSNYSDYPTTSGAYQEHRIEYSDVFVTKLNATGTQLIYSTFIGGMEHDYGYGIAIDDGGNAYITGQTNSDDYPTTPGSYDETFNGGSYRDTDVFVTKLNSNGTDLIYSTFIGSSDDEEGFDIALNGMGMAYITGYTKSVEFPTTSGVFELSHKNGYDAFVTKLNSGGTDLIYSTFLGGSMGEDYSSDISLDTAGNVIIIGHSNNSEFPTTSGVYDDLLNNEHSLFMGINQPNDIFVVKMNQCGTGLIFATFLGGYNHDFGHAIDLDCNDNIYITGLTKSRDFPTTDGAFNQTFYYDDYSVFVTKMNSTGTALLYSTNLGRVVCYSLYDYKFRNDIAVDSDGCAFISGSNNCSNFPTTSGAFQETFYYHDVFITKLNNSGSDLIYSSLLGGTNIDYGNGIEIDSFGNAYIVGTTQSSDFPTTNDAFDETHNGNYDVFVTKMNSGGTDILFSTFLGGENSETGYSIAVDSTYNVCIAGDTSSANFPTTYGAYDETFNGDYGKDAFVSKLNSEGSALVFSTFLGGSQNDTGYGLAMDNAENVIVIGETKSNTFPTTVDAFDRTFNNESDVFITKLNNSGTELLYSTFLGGVEDDSGKSVASDSLDNVYITGVTNSFDYPATDGALIEHNHGNHTSFVSKLSFFISFNYLLNMWRTNSSMDPNGDGFIDVRDFIYTIEFGPEPCP